LSGVIKGLLSLAECTFETEAMAVANDDLTGSIDHDWLPEEERKAYWEGYNDYVPQGVLKPAYNPPTGNEKAYREGWNTRRLEEDEQLLREWTGLP